ncbi:MAG: ATP-dependent helicase [Methanobrevibacter sp.]|jgi:DNA helicase-2/ATP-dependent DNA helicase PcrA|nr:ATP-dependent helicase [Candidatus Methanoflexus mossambicus]
MGIELSQEQERIVNSEDKNILIRAGAGSGKTLTLTRRIIHLADNLDHGEKILSITFSNRAADELKKRLFNSLGEEKTLNNVFIGTIHQFCLELVKSRGNLIGLPQNLHIFKFEDRIKILNDAINNLPQFKDKFLKFSKNNYNNKLKNCLNKIEHFKKEYNFERKNVDNDFCLLFEEYNRLLIEQNALDYDDIIIYAYKILTERKRVLRLYRTIYKYICVDEAQDLNNLQYEFINLLSGGKINITMVGDPNQSIYGFNKSSSSLMEDNFILDYDPEIFELNENYRSSKEIINAARKIEKSFEINGNCKFDGEFKITGFKDEEDEARAICKKIDYFLKNGHKDIDHEIKNEDILVIGRNRYVFNSLEQVFKSKKYDYTLKTSNNSNYHLESDFINAFNLGMKILSNPMDKIHLNQLQELSGIKLFNNSSNNKIFDIELSNDNLNPPWDNYCSYLYDAWKIITSNQEQIDFDKVLKILNSFIENNESLMSDEKIEENLNLDLILEDINTLTNNWKVFLKKSRKNNRSLDNFLRAISMGDTKNNVDKGIVLSTVHMAKGLEFDIVFIIGVNEGTFPDYRAKTKSELNEEKHNFFVSITRAKRICYVSYLKYKHLPWGKIRLEKSQFIDSLNS